MITIKLNKLFFNFKNPSTALANYLPNTMSLEYLLMLLIVNTDKFTLFFHMWQRQQFTLKLMITVFVLCILIVCWSLKIYDNNIFFLSCFSQGNRLIVLQKEYLSDWYWKKYYLERLKNFNVSGSNFLISLENFIVENSSLLIVLPMDIFLSVILWQTLLNLFNTIKEKRFGWFYILVVLFLSLGMLWINWELFLLVYRWFLLLVGLIHFFLFFVCLSENKCCFYLEQTIRFKSLRKAFLNLSMMFTNEQKQAIRTNYYTVSGFNNKLFIFITWIICLISIGTTGYEFIYGTRYNLFKDVVIATKENMVVSLKESLVKISENPIDGCIDFFISITFLHTIYGKAIIMGLLSKVFSSLLFKEGIKGTYKILYATFPLMPGNWSPLLVNRSVQEAAACVLPAQSHIFNNILSYRTSSDPLPIITAHKDTALAISRGADIRWAIGKPRNDLFLKSNARSKEFVDLDKNRNSNKMFQPLKQNNTVSFSRISNVNTVFTRQVSAENCSSNGNLCSDIDIYSLNKLNTESQIIKNNSVIAHPHILVSIEKLEYFFAFPISTSYERQGYKETFMKTGLQNRRHNGLIAIESPLIQNEEKLSGVNLRGIIINVNVDLFNIYSPGRISQNFLELSNTQINTLFMNFFIFQTETYALLSKPQYRTDKAQLVVEELSFGDVGIRKPLFIGEDNINLEQHKKMTNTSTFPRVEINLFNSSEYSTPYRNAFLSCLPPEKQKPLVLLPPSYKKS